MADHALSADNRLRAGLAAAAAAGLVLTVLRWRRNQYGRQRRRRVTRRAPSRCTSARRRVGPAT